MGACLVVDKTGPGVLGITTVDPTSDAARYYYAFEKKRIIDPIPFDSIRIEKEPLHGKLTFGKNAGGLRIITYLANPGHTGKDRFEAVVPAGKEVVRLVYFLRVQNEWVGDGPDSKPEKYCPKSEWKILSAPRFDYASEAIAS